MEGWIVNLLLIFHREIILQKTNSEKMYRKSKTNFYIQVRKHQLKMKMSDESLEETFEHLYR